MSVLSTTTLVVIIKLITGSLQYLVMYIMNHSETSIEKTVEYEKGGVVTGKMENQKFKRNYFNAFFIFASMLAIGAPVFIKECRKFNESRKLAGLAPAHPYNKRAYMLTLLPSFLDVVAVEMGTFAGNSIAPSHQILLKSLRIVISAFLTKYILGKAQKPYQWLAVVITMIGVAPIAMTGGWRKDAEDAEKLAKNGKKIEYQTPLMFAYMAVLLGEIFRGVRYVYEEKLIKTEKLSAEFIVFTESMIGFAISGLIVVFAHFVKSTDGKPIEDFTVTCSMISGSTFIQVLMLVNILLVGIHNYSTTLITKHLTSMHNMIISQGRAVVSWGIGAIIMVVRPGIKTGESLDRYSFIDLIGYFFLVLGAMIYSGYIKVLKEQDEETKSPVDSAVSTAEEEEVYSEQETTQV